MESANEQPALLTYKEVASRLKCCVRKIRDDYVKPGHLRTVRLGHLVRFQPGDVDDFIRSLAGGAA